MTEWITPRQVVDDPRLPLGNVDFIYKALKSGRLEGSKLGGRWVTTWPAVEAWIESGSNSVRRRKNRATT